MNNQINECQSCPYDSWASEDIHFHEESGIITVWSNELSSPLDVSKDCEALYPEKVED